METPITPITPKTVKKFICASCDFICCKLSDWNRHITTSKHTKHDFGNGMEQNGNAEKIVYICPTCNKNYVSASGLWKHNKKCMSSISENKVESTIVLQLLQNNNELQKQNQDFKDLLVEQNKFIVEQNNKMLETFQEVCKNGMGNTVNSHNKAFNLNVFLNEDCKDAMNVTQFIDSFNLQLSDFENVGNVGFVNGISDIIIKKLKALDISERPIHCTDQKRQVLYARVLDKWEKEGDDNKILRRIIKCVAFKNSKNIQLFRDKYPDCMNWDSKHADRYQILRIESLGGLGNEDVDNENKIIRKIAREILIDKNT